MSSTRLRINFDVPCRDDRQARRMARLMKVAAKAALWRTPGWHVTHLHALNTPARRADPGTSDAFGARLARSQRASNDATSGPARDHRRRWRIVIVYGTFKERKRWQDFLTELEMIEVDTEFPEISPGVHRIDGEQDVIVRALKRAGTMVSDLVWNDDDHLLTGPPSNLGSDHEPSRD